LVTKAKGIYKPIWSKYALSVRHSLGSPYPDLEPVLHDDGTWSYAYYQEGLRVENRDDEFTNRALLQCAVDNVPVAVLRQLSERPASYFVFGLALVAGWGNGYFLFNGFAPDGYGHRLQDPADVMVDTASERSDLFDPQSVIDERSRVVAQVVQRRGQPEFRRRVLAAYEQRCAMSECDAPQALEACHIYPYLGPATNDVSNGLLLRADLHTLFDLGLIAVHPASLKVEVAGVLGRTAYSKFSGASLRLPRRAAEEPSRDCLAAHREWAGF
jgi:hypothetical protein